MTLHPRPASPEVPCDVETDHPHGGESHEHCGVVNAAEAAGMVAATRSARPDHLAYLCNGLPLHHTPRASRGRKGGGASLSPSSPHRGGSVGR